MIFNKIFSKEYISQYNIMNRKLQQELQNGQDQMHVWIGMISFLMNSDDKIQVTSQLSFPLSKSFWSNWANWTNLTKPVVRTSARNFWLSEVQLSNLIMRGTGFNPKKVLITGQYSFHSFSDWLAPKSIQIKLVLYVNRSDLSDQYNRKCLEKAYQGCEYQSFKCFTLTKYRLDSSKKGALNRHVWGTGCHKVDRH